MKQRRNGRKQRATHKETEICEAANVHKFIKITSGGLQRCFYSNHWGAIMSEGKHASIIKILTTEK